MLYFAEGSPTDVIERDRSRRLVADLVDALGPARRVLLLPPDYTRLHSGAGELTTLLFDLLAAGGHVEVMPALGTHAPMTASQREHMFPGIPDHAFRIHDWRRDLVQLGEVPSAVIRKLSDHRLDFPIRCEVNRRLADGGWDHILSIGQLVPHEVAGIANHAKNVFVGAGGPDTIHRTHYLGAVCGMEQAMGRVDTPVRAVLDYMARRIAPTLPVTYLLTVRDRDDSGSLVTRGLFAGDDEACFRRGADLCRQVNMNLLDEPIRKAIVYLDPAEFKSTWLGNKAIYRLRMAMADGGELIVIAPGVEAFGEDAAIDRLIRKYGYHGTEPTLRFVAEHADLAENLAAAAHLIHGSTEGRFNVTYCPERLTRAEVQGVGFGYAEPGEIRARYNPTALTDGWNTVGRERVFFVSHPGLALWALRRQFDSPEVDGP